ncbi:BTB/POZ domain-containing protein At3g08570-like [Cynara cardunculus var. scolymus]|uniref:BTB/POZ fold n=1 Tax=Cynara cardunculus var. scolymus TaxID=59895 RepID=A0A103YLN1_CYNCS|nr:BTB/POZ domain-containing protein At3g08570-like [Cynara cardunculus var. scolymus]KVI11333.1 BTB/POZ fold [Cynara cardunculus var. scolymus]
MVLSDHNSRSSPTPRFCNSFANRIFSDVAGDITIIIDGVSFLLHKFPLVSQSGKIRKMVAEAKDPNLSKLELINFPGGHEAFELAAKFCYGMNFEIMAENVAHLHCAAKYLEMTEDYREENLITRTEAYLNEVVTQSLEKSVQVLCSCETILPLADHVGIIDKCVDAIAKNVCKEQLVAGLSRLECDSGPIDAKSRCLEWWIEDLSVLTIDLYQRIISVMVSKGIRQDSVIASIMHYAQTSLKGIGKSQIWNPARTTPVTVETGQRVIVETLVNLLPNEKSSLIPIVFLFGMLRMAIMVDSSLACRLALERRIAGRLEMVLLDDLLIPSVQTGDSLFDVDTIHRILVHFLQIIEQADDEDCGYESDGGIGSPSHGSLLKVGRLIDAYLAEIAPDPYLSFQKFIGMIEVLPDYARVIDDGLYRAVDIYLKAHPILTEHERKKICKFIDCEKLSQEACNHAAQNDRLPAHMGVRVLYFEQLRLKSAITGTSALSGYMSQKMGSSGAPSAAMSPRDTYAALRRENRDLKLEISRMRVRLSDLEKEQVCMKQGMMDKLGNGKTFLTSISRGIGKFGIFGGPTNGKQQKNGTGRKSRSSTRRRGYSLS